MFVSAVVLWFSLSQHNRNVVSVVIHLHTRAEVRLTDAKVDILRYRKHICGSRHVVAHLDLLVALNFQLTHAAWWKLSILYSTCFLKYHSCGK